MNIITVEYKRLRTIEGAYENETIGAVSQVAEDEDPDVVLANLDWWVNSQFDARINAQERNNHEQHAIREASNELEQVRRDLEQAKGQWALAQEFAKKLGIDLQEIPF